MLSSLALLVVVVIDQFRTDELLRAQYHLNPSGIGLLVNQGIFYDDAHHTQFFNMTCPGHTAVSTGAMPGLHGISLNDDWDRENHRNVYCVSDPDHKWIDADRDANPNLGTSAKRILVSTLGDESKLAWGDESEVVAVAMKDRSAIALGGHSADGAYWFAPKSNKWTTSNAYERSGKLPQWLVGFNKTHVPSKSSKNDEYEQSDDSIKDVTDLALAAAQNHKLGHHKRTDILWVSFSTHDYVGHYTGDDSAQLKATLHVEDEAISRLLSTLKKNLGGKKILVALTADHGAGVDSGEAQAKYKIPGGKENEATLLSELNKCAGSSIKIDKLNEQNVYLTNETNTEANRKKVKTCFTQLTTSTWSAFTRDEIQSNQVPEVPWLKNLAASYNPERGADVVGVLKPYWNSHDDKLVNHETPYDYDSWVPLALWWPGVRHKSIHHRVEVISLAPTLARILNTRRPSGATGEYLTEVLESMGL